MNTEFERLPADTIRRIRTRSKAQGLDEVGIEDAKKWRDHKEWIELAIECERRLEG